MYTKVLQKNQVQSSKIIITYIHKKLCCNYDIDQAVNHWFLTMEAGAQSLGSPFGICG
jgi:hypothetical protein